MGIGKETIEMFKKQKLTINFMSLSVLPLLAFGVVVTIIMSFVAYDSLSEEVEYSLKVLAYSSYHTLETKFPGPYEEVDGRMKKGDVFLDEHMDEMDNIKKMSEADATLFLGDTRYLTTVLNEDGTRAKGTHASETVKSYVIHLGKDYFSDDVQVNGVQYYGYYIPVKNADDIIGMMFVGKPRYQVIAHIVKTIYVIIACAAGVMAIAIAISIFYSKKTIYALNKTKKFLGDIAQGDLTAAIDPYVLTRHDEIGEMGKFAVMLQDSIVDLVGKDPLTGLHNRRSCNVVLESLIEKVQQGHGEFVLAMGDIDFFKKINDTYGHQAGDEVLRRLSTVLSNHMEHLGFVFRWGGEEFVLIYEDMDKQEAHQYLEKLQKEIHDMEIVIHENIIHISITFGISDSDDIDDFHQMISIADHYLYIGKKAGRNRIVSAYKQENTL